MAFYRIEVKNISRGEGRSAVAAAAYRSAEKIENLWDGVESDYTRKSGVVFKEIFLPENAPEEYKDRSTLWNAVELAEPSSKCRLAREFLLSLPVELDLEQQIEVVEQFVQKNLTGTGMCADVSIHSPIYRDDLYRPLDADDNPTNDPNEFIHNNPHAHILATVRPIGKNGKWEAKTQKEYLCRRGDEEKGFTGEEFKNAQLDGWEKQFRFIGHDGKKVWLTPSEAKEKGLDNSDRVNKYPRSTKHGRENPTTAYWDDRRRVKEWRKSWEEILNRKFAELGIDALVDSRSYAERGIDKMPGVHMDPHSNNQEKRASRLEREGRQAEHTELGERNRIARAYNKSAAAYHKTDEEAAKRTKAMAERGGHLQNSNFSHLINGDIVGRSLAEAMEAAKNEEASINTCLGLLDRLVALEDKASQVIAELTAQLNNLGNGRRKQRAELEEQINKEKQKVSEYRFLVQSEIQNKGYFGEENIRKAAEENSAKIQELKERIQRLDERQEARKTNTKEYRELTSSVPALYKERFEEAMGAEIQQHAEDERNELKELLGSEFSETELRRFLKKTEELMNGRAARLAEKSHHKRQGR